MSKQKQAESQRDSHKPQVAPSTGGAEQIASPDISGLSLIGGNVMAQASRLSDSRFSITQRQQMAGQIAQIGGNQHMGLVMRAMKQGARPIVQPKLEVNEPNDKYEQEADRTADQVMRMAEPNIVAHDPMKLQRASNGAGVEVTPDLEDNVKSLQGRGQPLPETERNFFESRFGTDFSQVRIHNDSQAAETSNALQARAFTVGSDVAFSSGEYQPGTSEGRRLMAHELTHVVQQTGGVQLQARTDETSEADQVMRAEANVIQRDLDPTTGGKIPIEFSRDFDIGKTTEGGLIKLSKVSIKAKGSAGVTDGKKSDDSASVSPIGVNDSQGSGSKGDTRKQQISVGVEAKTEVENELTQAIEEDLASLGVEDFKLTHKVSAGGKIGAESSFKVSYEVGMAVKMGGLKGTLSTEFVAYEGKTGTDKNTGEVKNSQTVAGLVPKVSLMGSTKLKSGATFEGGIEASVTIEPDWLAIGRKVAEEFAATAAADAIIAAGFVAGGIATIGGALAALSDADDLKVIPDQAYRMIKNMSEGYQAGIKGDDNAGFGPMYDDGYAQGRAQREKALEKVPAQVFDDEVKKKSLNSEARALMIPQVKAAVLKQWADTHWFDMNIDGEKGYRTLDTIMSGWE